MRLNNYNSNKKSSAGDPDGPSADIVEHILQTSEKKRSRPTSSLDIKVEDGSKMTTPPSKDANKKQTSRTPPKEQQQQRKIAHNTRARRGRLPSHMKYEGMDEEELLQALYDDPEVAAGAAASQQSKKTDKSKPYSKKSKSVKQYPDHLKSMMDEGVPVTQWIIVLVLLGAGFYQLKKSLSGPSSSTATGKSGARKVTDRGLGRKNGKQKGKKNNTKSKAKAKTRPAVEEQHATAMSPIEEELVSEQEAIPLVEKKATKKKAATKKRARKQKGLARPSTAGSDANNDEGSHESPDSVSTDGSSSTENVAQSEDDRVAHVAEETQLRSEDVRVDTKRWQTLKGATDEGWQTVRKKSELKKVNGDIKTEYATENDTENASAAEDDEAFTDADKVESRVEEPEAVKSSGGESTSATAETAESAADKAGSSGVESTPTSGESAETADKASPAGATETQPDSKTEVKKRSNGSKKKKSKKKKAAVPATKQTKQPAAEENNRNDTSDDEALALRLQQEEEKFALATPPVEPSQVEEVWEEVSKAKRKKKPSTPVIEAA